MSTSLEGKICVVTVRLDAYALTKGWCWRHRPGDHQGGSLVPHLPPPPPFFALPPPLFSPRTRTFTPPADSHQAYLDAGAEGITLVDLTPPPLSIFPEQHREKILTVAGDVSKPETHDEYIRKTVEKWGRLDVAAQVAGTCSSPASVLDTKLEDWDAAFAVNARGSESLRSACRTGAGPLTPAFLGLQACTRAMLASPSGGKDCAVVLICSQFGLEGLAGFSAYSASKFAVRGLMQVAAQEFAPMGIRVNAICPGREFERCSTES